MKICDDLYWYPLRKPIQTFLGRGATCNVFGINQGEEIWLIDAGTVRLGRFQRLLKYMEHDGLETKKITKIFVTHAHGDHTTAIPVFQDKFHVDVYIHEADAFLLAGGDDAFWEFERKAAGPLKTQMFPVSDGLLRFAWSYSLGITLPIQNFHTLQDNSIMKGTRYSLQCIHTPGHSPGHASYYIPEIKALFCGDLMDPYFDYKPPVNLPSSDFDAFLESIEKVAKLPVEIFCPAHTAKIYHGNNIFTDICRGTIKQMQYGKDHTIELLRAKPGMEIKEFKGKFPNRIWQFQEHTSVPYAVIKSLMRQNKIRQDGLRFFYIE